MSSAPGTLTPSHCSIATPVKMEPVCETETDMMTTKGEGLVVAPPEIDEDI